MNDLRLYLASASPRRQELLRQVGLAPITVPHSVDERPLDGEVPEAMVLRLSEAKGREASRRLTARPAGVVLAADTAVVLGGEVLGKPVDASDAERMLRRLRAREHEVLTGVFVLRTDDGRFHCAADSTRVRFRDFDDATLLDYVASGEPVDKAGAYGIQGRGALLTDGIVGSWSNVVGLPLERLPGWIAAIGVDLQAWIAGRDDDQEDSPIISS